MSGRKDQLKPYHTIIEGDMTTTITSDPTSIANLDNICIQLNFVGSAVGTFEIQGSADYYQDGLVVENAGFWIPLVLNPVPVAAGTDGNILLDMNQLSFPYIRIVYVPTSGSGTLDAYIGGKQV